MPTLRNAAVLERPREQQVSQSIQPPSAGAAALQSVKSLLDDWAKSVSRVHYPRVRRVPASGTCCHRSERRAPFQRGVGQAFDAAGQSALARELDGLLTPACTANVAFENIRRSSDALRYTMRVRHNARSVGHVAFKLTIPGPEGPVAAAQWARDVPPSGLVEEQAIALPVGDVDQQVICSRSDLIRESWEKRRAEVLARAKVAAADIAELERLREDVNGTGWKRFGAAILLRTKELAETIKFILSFHPATQGLGCVRVSTAESSRL